MVNRIQHHVSCVALVIGSIVLWLILSAFDLLDGLEQEAMRWRYLARGEMVSTAPIVYVDLDPQTVASIGARPWDRANFAVLLNALLGPGEAKAVGVDIIFSQLGRGSLLDLERTKAGDLALGQAVRRYKDQVVLAAAYTGTTGPSAVPMIRSNFDNPAENVFPESPSYPIIDWEVGRLGLANVDEELGKGVVPQFVVGFVEVHGEVYSRVLMQGMRMHLFDVMNEPQIIEDEETFILTGKDGWSPQQIPKYSEQVLYSLGLELFLVANGLTHDSVDIKSDRLIIRKEGEVFREVPLVDQQSIAVNWFEGWQTNPSTEHVSMQEVQSRANALGRAARLGEAEAVAENVAWFKRFKDKVVFVGPVDPQLKDIAPTPFNREPVPKVGLHANLYRTIHDEAYVAHPSKMQSVLILVVLTGAVALLSLWNGFGGEFARFGSIALIAVYGLVVLIAFAKWNFALPMIAAFGASISVAIGVLLIKLGVEEYERRRIKNLFGAYVSPELVDEIVDSQRDPKLGGVEAEISALFSDVEGFSTLSEQLDPNELVALMNEYLGAMTEVIQSEGGALDKYIGDAIATMFGMPLPLPDHASRSCLSAQRMQERHADLRKEWAASGRRPEAILNMRTRIGINTGMAVIGNMGSHVRFNYTMMGDAVNLAARCESGAKIYGVYTMITEAALSAAKEVTPDLPTRKLDRIIVQGRTQPVEVYELWDRSVDLVEAMQCAKHYEAGLAEYFNGNWSVALECFALSLTVEPWRAFALTTPSKLMSERCQRFQKEGTPENWDGVYRLKTK
ncbi:MAG: adenylate/guanylate cyclase domain-containing protein [Lentimonas sp.]